MTDWLPFFQRLTQTLAPVCHLFGTVEARMVVGRGASGDTTVRIDRFAEELILSELEAHHNNTGEGLTIVSEEAGILVHGDGKTLVLVDPIDGSNNAKRGLPLYATTMAVARGSNFDDLVCGYTLNHASGECFYADRRPDGEGSLKAHRTLYNWLPFVPHHDLPPDGLEMLGIEMPDTPDDVAPLVAAARAFKKSRVLGAMALDIAYVGTGGFDAFFHPKPSRPIDFAGAAVFLLGAGGTVTTLEGNPLETNLGSLERGPRLMACRTPQILEKILPLLQGLV